MFRKALCSTLRRVRTTILMKSKPRRIQMFNKAPWAVSLHGGHSGQFCDHAVSTLTEVLEAAVAAGFHTYGVSEHCPRTEAHLLYDKERELGWTVETLEAMFAEYQEVLADLTESFADRLIVLRGFETEVVPEDRYIAQTEAWRAQMKPDFIVGSVHHIDEIPIDGPKTFFEEAMAKRGGLEKLAVAYYAKLGEMIEALKPEVVGHFDLIRKNAGPYGSVETPVVRDAALRALEVAQKHDVILDLNTAGYRKGLGSPYPAPWLLKEADAMGLGFCFGDDSHGTEQVGLDLGRSRRYLLDHGIDHITILTREQGVVVKKRAPLL